MITNLFIVSKNQSLVITNYTDPMLRKIIEDLDKTSSDVHTLTIYLSILLGYIVVMGFIILIELKRRK